MIVAPFSARSSLGPQWRRSACSSERPGEDRGLVTWRDTIRTALMALGPATVDEIVAHLHECGIERPRGAVTTTLCQLKDAGEVQKRGEQWVLNQR